MKLYICTTVLNFFFMKNLRSCFLLLMVLLSCQGEQKETLTFKPNSFQSESCTMCPVVSITIPQAIENSKLGLTINDAITQAVVLELIYDDAVEANTLEEAVQSFKNGFLELKEMYPDESLGWEAKINGELTYEDAAVITIKIDSYIFTGGAHGQSTTRFLNFDKKKGVQIETSDLFEEDPKLLTYAETKFRNQEQIPEGTSINSTGFMFENNSFYLPENIGYTKEGIQLLYEQYEVASYAEGPIVLLLPYAEVQGFLKVKPVL